MQPTHLDSTRVAYDTVARDYADQLRPQLHDQPVDRAMLRLFTELTHGLILDVGSGPGHITSFLADHGADVSGVDLSPEMVAVAHHEYSGIHFSVGSMHALQQPDSALGGIVAWYSIIHTPPAQLADVFAEFHRVLGPGGYVALAFQVGDELRHIEHGYGHDVSLDAYRLLPSFVESVLVEAGFVPYCQAVREPVAPETVQQAYLIARKA